MPEAKSPRPKRNSAPVDHWFRSSDDVRTGFVSGNRFDMKRVRYSLIGDMAIVEGDIAIGTVQQVERAAVAAADPTTIPQSGVAVTGARFRWPGAVIPFEIAPGFTNPQRVLDAMARWSAVTPLRFVPREAGNTAHDNYVSFEEHDGCWSEVGMRGGKQIVSLAASCQLGSALHEVGHVAGLWHEQSRADRDQFVRVLWENILEGREHNFDQRITDGDDIGDYDYASIMHYPALAFTKNGQATIVPLRGAEIGQRTRISDLDAAAITAMYSGTGTPTIAPRRGEIQSARLGPIGPHEVKRWVTDGWPVDWTVHWSIVPSPTGTQVEWSLVTERQSLDTLRYILEVRNLGHNNATVDARYAIL